MTSFFESLFFWMKPKPPKAPEISFFYPDAIDYKTIFPKSKFNHHREKIVSLVNKSTQTDQTLFDSSVQCYLPLKVAKKQIHIKPKPKQENDKAVLGLKCDFLFETKPYSTPQIIDLSFVDKYLMKSNNNKSKCGFVFDSFEQQRIDPEIKLESPEKIDITTDDKKGEELNKQSEESNDAEINESKDPEVKIHKETTVHKPKGRFIFSDE